jgi:hypothetical protein
MPAWRWTHPILREVLGDPLFHILLRDYLIPDAEFEAFLVRLRSSLLLDDEVRAQAATDFLCALALQCFHNEFIYVESELESDRISALLPELERTLQSCGRVEERTLRSLLILATYRPLNTGRRYWRFAVARGEIACAGCVASAIGARRANGARHEAGNCLHG